MKTNYKTIEDLQQLSKQFKTPELLCNNKLEYACKNDKIMIKLISRYKEAHPNYNSDTLYFDTFKDNIKTVRMINDYYDKNIFTETKIERAMILESGRNYADAFSGIRIKKMSYTNDYIIEILDGELGQCFIKTYKRLPTAKQMIYDSVYPDILYNDDSKTYKPSIIDFYN